MSLESIVSRILDEAEKEKEKIVQQARQDKDVILQKAQLEAERIFQEALEKEKAGFAAEKQKLLVGARLETKKGLLEARQELIDEVFVRLKSETKKEKIKKHQVSQSKTEEVPEDLDFYLNNLRHEQEIEIAKIIFG